MLHLLRRSSSTIIIWTLLFLFSAQDLVQAQEPGVFTDRATEYEWRIKQTRLSGHYIPNDVPEALKVLEQLVDKGARAKVLALGEDQFVKRLFFGFGKWMMINWSFYEGSRLSHHFREIGISHPDDMTTAMMLFYHRHVRGDALQIAETAEILAEKREQLRNQPSVPALSNGN